MKRINPKKPLGEQLINFMFHANLYTAECPDAPESGCVIIWTANAAEQIEAFVSEYARKQAVSANRPEIPDS